MNSVKQRAVWRRLARTHEVIAESRDMVETYKASRRRRRGRWALTDGTVYIRGRSRSQLRRHARRWSRYGARVVRHQKDKRKHVSTDPGFVISETRARQICT